MNKLTTSIISILLLAFMIIILLTSCGSTSISATPTPLSTGTSDGERLVQERCTKCHSIKRTTSAHKTADRWASTVERMIKHGAKLDEQEQQTLIEYLAQTYP